MSGRADASGRRLLSGLAVAFALGGVGLLYGASQPWQRVTITQGDPLPDLVKVLQGGTLVPMLTALGVLSLAAIVGLLATGALGRRLVGVVVLGASIVTAYLVWQALTASEAERAAAAEQVSDTASTTSAGEVSHLAIAGGIGGVVLVLVASAALLVLAQRLPKMGARYERDAGPKTGGDPETEERERWKALDRGEDPTD